MNDQKIKMLSENLRSLKSANFYNPNWAFVGFKSDFKSICQDVIRVALNPSDREPYDLADDLNVAIQPVINKWIKMTENKIKEAAAEE